MEDNKIVNMDELRDTINACSTETEGFVQPVISGSRAGVFFGAAQALLKCNDLLGQIPQGYTTKFIEETDGTFNVWIYDPMNADEEFNGRGATLFEAIAKAVYLYPAVKP